MISVQTSKTINLYAALLEEMKIRIHSIEAAVHTHSGFPAPIIREFCYLQLRMLCELIALGCLMAHGDIKATQSNKLQKQYAADRIITELEKLHPDFYPQPVRQDPQDRFLLFKIDTGFLTKNDLIKLNGKCGSILHRGSVRKLLNPNQPIEIHFSDVMDWLGKIKNLLRMHLIKLFDGKHYIGILHNKHEGGKSQVVVIEPYKFEQPSS